MSRGPEPALAEPDADDQHAGVGQAGGDAAERERERGEALGPRRCRLVGGDGRVDALLGPRLDRVGAHHRGTDHGLGDGGEQRADLASYGRVGGRQLALEVAQAEEERREADPHDQRQLPAVDHHQHGRDQDLADADDEQQTAEHQELTDLVDVTGHAGHQRAAALGVLGQQRQVVDVAERLDPQGGEAALGGGEQARRHGVRRPAGQDDRGGGRDRQPGGEGRVRPVGPAQAAVDRLLHGDGYDDLADRRDDGERQRLADAVDQLGRVPDAAADRLPGADVLAGLHLRAGGPGRGHGAHGAATSSGSPSAWSCCS